MDKDFLDRLEEILHKYNFLEKQLLDLNVLNDSKLYLEIYKEFSSMKNIVSLYLKYNDIIIKIKDTESMLINDNSDIKDLILEELSQLSILKNDVEINIINYFKPKDKNNDIKSDVNNIFLEIRAATGGSEAAIFSEDLFKMYANYFNYKQWKLEIMSINYGSHGGFKEIISRIIGNNVFDKMKNESGVHRVQRVPKTEARGRVHTSTASVAILPELEIVDDVYFNSSDIRIDTYRSSGAGGQHVNTTDSAVRVIHKPTGLIAECQDERSQHKNKQKALSLLKSRLLMHEQNKQKTEIDSYRKNLIGYGYRSEKIRTYNYIDNRITDHRFNFTLYKLNEIMDGKSWILLDYLE